MRELLAELAQALERERECVYCAIVETRGSTPQKAGAAMLVFADGSQAGTLGGGCVEAEVKQRALRLLNDRGPSSIFTFSLDDNYGWDDGLICGGRMRILADPIIARNPAVLSGEYYRKLHEQVERGQGCTEAVVLSPEHAGLPAGTRFLFDATPEVVARVAPSTGEASGLFSEHAPETIRRHLSPLHRRPRPSVQHGVAYLPILPRVTLLIVGGGHVGQAVAKLAADVDFDIWVLDDRESYASHERFPMARRRMVGDIGSSLKELAGRDITPSIYALIVTRGHAHDEEALFHLATTHAGYVGMIGSKRKIKLIYDDLLARGVPADALDKVHAPLGLDIGSQTVPEIAVSIVAELIASRNLGTTRS